MARIILDDNANRWFSTSGHIVHGRGGDDRLSGHDGQDYFLGDSGDDRLYGYGGVDILFGGDGSDVIYGHGDTDFLEGGLPGQVGLSGVDQLYGGSGDDRLSGIGTESWLYGGTGDDMYWVDSDGLDRVVEYAGQGIDTVTSLLNTSGLRLEDNVENLRLMSNDTGSIRYGAGNELNNSIWGTNDEGRSLGDILVGLEGNDSIYGGAGNDHLYGNEGRDRLDGETGADRMEGGPGGDTYLVDDLRDLVVEADASINGGVDWIVASVHRILEDNVENLWLTGSADLNSWGNDLANRIYGQAGHNVLAGRGGDDVIVGMGGRDRIHGGDGDDLLYGDSGNDRLVGGRGADSLYGGAGADVFEFNSVADMSTHDTIHGFDAPGRSFGDRIDLYSVDADADQPGNQALQFVPSGTSTIGIGGYVSAVFERGDDTMVFGRIEGREDPYFYILIEDGDEIRASDYTADDFIL